jgi:hypothetical protein
MVCLRTFQRKDRSHDCCSLVLLMNDYEDSIAMLQQLKNDAIYYIGIGYFSAKLKIVYRHHLNFQTISSGT